MRGRNLTTAVAAVALAVGAYSLGADRDAERATARANAPVDLWKTYSQVLKRACCVDLTHTITPGMPVWKGFSGSQFSPTINPDTGKAYTYAADGFEATHYGLSTDQFGTQLDPPAHWAPEYPGIDELPLHWDATAGTRIR
jgi:Putative cyclase